MYDLIGASELISQKKVSYGNVIVYDLEENSVTTIINLAVLEDGDLKEITNIVQDYCFYVYSCYGTLLIASSQNVVKRFDIDFLENECTFYFYKPFRIIELDYSVGTEPTKEKEPETVEVSSSPSFFSNLINKIRRWFLEF